MRCANLEDQVHRHNDQEVVDARQRTMLETMLADATRTVEAHAQAADEQV